MFSFSKGSPPNTTSRNHETLTSVSQQKLSNCDSTSVMRLAIFKAFFTPNEMMPFACGQCFRCALTYSNPTITIVHSHTALCRLEQIIIQDVYTCECHASSTLADASEIISKRNGSIVLRTRTYDALTRTLCTPSTMSGV